MKKVMVILSALTILYMTACGNNSGNTGSSDSIEASPPAGPAPDNSNATNPSIPDTAFTDTANKTTDTMHK